MKTKEADSLNDDDIVIIENNLYGIDLDDRAVQIAQLGLYIKALKKNKNINFPIKVKTKNCEFSMRTEKYVDIREFDTLGRYKLARWSLPKVAVEELIDWDEKEK